MGPLLSVSGLKKIYEVRKTVFSLRKELIRAVDDVSFDVETGKTMGVVGESGSGKSTVARCVSLLEKPDAGKIFFLGKDWIAIGEEERKKMRKEMQIIFQDPYSSLNPRKRILDIVSEPLMAHALADKAHVREKVAAVLKSVGLDDDFLAKYPHEMSGGQRQRVAIGRALSTSPAFIIADEPVSSLDVSVQAQIINLFLDIKAQSVISMLFISHDLNIVRFVSDNIMVMYRGKIVEMGEKEELFCNPIHPYTQMLISTAEGEDYQRAGEDGSNGNCCVFSDRCPEQMAVCTSETPALSGGEGHRVACFLCDK